MGDESKLIRDWKHSDVQRMRNIVSKNYSDRTLTQVGYTKEQVERKEGDVWEENGKNWTIKNGIKMTITKLDLVKKTLQIPLVCPKCKRAMNKGNLDKQMYAVHHTCSDCVIEHETKLKRDGKFDEYQQNILKQGVQYHIKEIEDALLDLAMNTSEESFVTEAGDIETWKGNGLDKEEITKWMQEYLNNLKATVNP
jgi:hypothetical protein